MKEKTLMHLFFATTVLYVCCLGFITFPVNTILKPLPLIILIWWARVHLPTTSKWLFLFWALVLSVGGDMALTFNGEVSFLAGLGLFFVAHLFYIGFFFSKPQLHWGWLILIGILIGFASVMFQRFIPHLGGMYYPVMAYMCVLILMVSTALLSSEVGSLAKLGALLFLCSDTLLATQLFLKPGVPLSHAIIVTYYLAQFFILKGALLKHKAPTALNPS